MAKDIIALLIGIYETFGLGSLSSRSIAELFIHVGINTIHHFFLDYIVIIVFSSHSQAHKLISLRNVTHYYASDER